MPASKTKIAQKLKRLRQQQDLRQRELAERSGLSLVEIGQIECGMVKEPRLSTRKKLAKGLGVDIKELLD